MNNTIYNLKSEGVRRYAILLIAALLLLLYPQSQATEKEQAQWVTYPTFQHAPNQWFRLRKEVLIEGQLPDALPTLIAADSKYWLYINGELVVFEGQLKRGPSPQGTYYDEVDLAPYLKRGKNTIAVLLWYYGREGFSHKDSKMAGFVMSNDIFSSDSSWKIARYEAYQSTGNPQANYRLPESNVRFDARLSDENWMEAEYQDKDWLSAKCVGAIGCEPWNDLVKRPIPMFIRFELKKSSAFKKEGNRITVTFPYNMQYHPYIKVKAAAGKMIRISPDNLKTLNDVPLRAEYVTKEGVQSYLHLPWLSGHAAHIELEDGVELLELGYQESGYDTEFVGNFDIADDDIMRYIEKAKRTLYVNMRDTYFDCPDRERAQWIGDGVILMEEAFYLLDEKSTDMSRKMYSELFKWQRADGTLFGPIPAGNWHNELPQQILAAVGTQGLGRLYMYTGDRELIKMAYPHVKKYLSLWDVKDDGTVPFRKGGWTWGDWGSQIDRELAEHIWVYMALEQLAHMADILGKPEEAREARLDRAAIKKRLNNLFWTEEGYITPDHSEEIDDRGNALAVISGIADKEKYPTIIKLLKRVEHASPYMEKYVMEALFHMDEGRYAIERFKKRYGAMIRHPHCSTLWEFWTYEASINHAWSGGPLSVFYKKLAGIVPVKAGFEEFSIFPELLDYKHLDCQFLSVKGIISLDIKKENDLVTMSIEIPAQSRAHIRIPLSASQLQLPDAGKIKATHRDENYNYYLVESGTHCIGYKMMHGKQS